MALIQESDVGRLFNDQALIDEIVSGLVEDSNTMDQLAEDIAVKVQDALEDDSTTMIQLAEDIAVKVQDALEDDSDMRQRLVNAAVSNDVFKRTLIAKLNRSG